MAQPGWPLGLTQLLPLDNVLVKEKKSGLASSKFLVTALDGTVIFKERLTFSGSRSKNFTIHLRDGQGNEVIKLKRKCYLFRPKKLEVYLCGKLFSIVWDKDAWCTVLFIHDINDQCVLRVKRPFDENMESVYELQTLQKECIGSITKKWGGIMKELFTDLDNYRITFPQNLDVGYKATVIGISILIDFLRSEKF